MDEGPTLEDDLEAELRSLGFADAERLLDEFNLASISEDAADLPREIAKKAKERIEGYARILEDVLQPDNGLSAMNECSFFSDEELARIAKGYRELMALVRRHMAADVEGTQEAYRAFLRKALPRWEAQRAWLKGIASKLGAGWEREQPLQRKQGYFG